MLSLLRLEIRPLYLRRNFGMLTDKLSKMEQDKQSKEMKKEIQYLANKPTFTIVDYKQRINDEIAKIKNSIRAKFSTQSQAAEKDLEEEKKVLSSIFEEELRGEAPITGQTKEQIATVTQVSVEKVSSVFKKIDRYMRMHRLLREMKEQNLPLPDTMQELNHAYVKSGIEFHSKQNRYIRYQKRSRKQILGYRKFQMRSYD